MYELYGPIIPYTAQTSGDVVLVRILMVCLTVFVVFWIIVCIKDTNSQIFINIYYPR